MFVLMVFLVRLWSWHVVPAAGEYCSVYVCSIVSSHVISGIRLPPWANGKHGKTASTQHQSLLVRIVICARSAGPLGHPSHECKAVFRSVCIFRVRAGSSQRRNILSSPRFVVGFESCDTHIGTVVLHSNVKTPRAGLCLCYVIFVPFSRHTFTVFRDLLSTSILTSALKHTKNRPASRH